MANFCFLRVEKLPMNANVGASLAHNYRERKTPNADVEKKKQNQYCNKNAAQAMARYRELLPEKIRKNGVRCLEYIITASPECFKRMTEKQQAEYFNLTLKFLRDRHGAENIFDWGLHYDEKSPHLCVFVVPKINDKLNARHFCGGREKLSELQDDFFEKVGRSVGLDRGIKGSKARHQTVKQFYARMSSLEKAIEPPKKKFFESEKDYKERYCEQIAPLVAQSLDADRLRQRADQAAEYMKTVKDGYTERNQFFEGLTKEQQNQIYMIRNKLREETKEQQRILQHNRMQQNTNKKGRDFGHGR